jgi:hypothetical protein
LYGALAPYREIVKEGLLREFFPLVILIIFIWGCLCTSTSKSTYLRGRDIFLLRITISFIFSLGATAHNNKLKILSLTLTIFQSLEKCIIIFLNKS